MFHLKSLVSYYRDLLFCPNDCFKLRNRDICDTDGRKILSILFLQKVELGIRSGSQLLYKQPSQRTLGSITQDINGNLMLPVIMHLYFSTVDGLVLFMLKMMKMIPTSFKLPDLALFRASRSVGNQGQRAPLHPPRFKFKLPADEYAIRHG